MENRKCVNITHDGSKRVECGHMPADHRNDVTVEQGKEKRHYNCVMCDCSRLLLKREQE